MRKLALFLAALCIVAFIARQEIRHSRVTASVDRLVNRIDRLIEEMRVAQPGHLYTAWYSAGTPPVLQEVDTEWNGTETRNEWVARHNGAVAAKMAQYPPV